MSNWNVNSSISSSLSTLTHVQYILVLGWWNWAYLTRPCRVTKSKKLGVIIGCSVSPDLFYDFPHVLIQSNYLRESSNKYAFTLHEMNNPGSRNRNWFRLRRCNYTTAAWANYPSERSRYVTFTYLWLWCNTMHK